MSVMSRKIAGLDAVHRDDCVNLLWRSSLVDLIGVTRVAMNRESSRLVVVKGRREIVILNMVALRAVAKGYLV